MNDPQQSDPRNERSDRDRRAPERPGEQEHLRKKPAERTRPAVKPWKERTHEEKRRAAKTSWGGVAPWYDEHLAKEDTYHAKVVLPELLRLVAPAPGMRILDLACGQGYFARAFASLGASVDGVDISRELIERAIREGGGITYHVSPAENLASFEDAEFDALTCVLAIQNIEHAAQVFAESARVLKPGGALHIVMNHPAFRIPKASHWGFDGAQGAQYRRVDRYMSELRIPIAMHPGSPRSESTLSFHRPLQWYVKHLVKAGFSIDRLEEWISHKTSDSGPRARAENISRKEIPIFMYLRAKKVA